MNVLQTQSSATTPRRRDEASAPRKRGRSTALAALLADATDNVFVSELGSLHSRRRSPARFVAGPASGKIPKPVVLDAVEVMEVVGVESEAKSALDAPSDSPPLSVAPRVCAPPKKRVKTALAAASEAVVAPPDPPRLPVANASWRRPKHLSGI